MFERADPFKAVEFVQAYIDGAVYPSERLTSVIHRFTDVRLQMHLMDIQHGMANMLYHGPVQVRPELASSPGMILRLTAIDQAVIGGSRIAWEKLMGAVYFMETGRELARSSNRSVKRTFFQWAEDHPRWMFFEPYEDVVAKHDTEWRTPEFHTGSKLRGRIFGKTVPADPNELLVLSNALRNGIWPNIVAIARGGEPYIFGGLHSSAPNAPDSDPESHQRHTD